MFANQIAFDVYRAVAVTLALGFVGAVMRWVWKAILRQMRAEIQIAAQPNSDALEQAITAKIDELSARNDVQHAQNGEQLKAIEQRVAVVEANTEIHAERLDRGGERMDKIFASLDELQSAVSALRTDPPKQQPPEGDL